MAPKEEMLAREHTLRAEARAQDASTLHLARVARGRGGNGTLGKRTLQNGTANGGGRAQAGTTVRPSGNGRSVQGQGVEG